MNTIYKDILEIKYGIIAHQCNAKGVMGAGLALALRTQWPQVFDQYYEGLMRKKINEGDCQLVEVSENLLVANLIAQRDYGRQKGRCYTEYDLLYQSLLSLRDQAEIKKLPVFLPYLMGCGLAGGDWKIVLEMIERILPKATICQLQ
jgi:O-acetyl-ADP-ribose deacetylase (regulator of RNase III)